MKGLRRMRNRKGFTLIELMIVVAIIALLIAILLPSLARAREQAMQVACAANLDAIHKGMFYYAEDPTNGNGYLPQLGWRIDMFPGAYWTNQISKYIAIKRTRAGARNGLTVCPAHETPALRHIIGDNAGADVTNIQDKIRCDTGQGGGTRRRGGGGGGGGQSLECHIEPVSYTGTCDALETVVWPQVSASAAAYPMKWHELKRPHCFIMLTESADDSSRVARCFRLDTLVNAAPGNPDYKRHYGGQSEFSNGSNFLFGDGHTAWHSAHFTGTRLICCMDLGSEGGNQDGSRSFQQSLCGTAGGGGTRRR